VRGCRSSPRCSRSAIIKLFGLAAAVFIDAVIIRSVLAPAIMQLFAGRRQL
jgi:hypothetical protein